MSRPAHQTGTTVALAAAINSTITPLRYLAAALAAVLLTSMPIRRAHAQNAPRDGSSATPTQSVLTIHFIMTGRIAEEGVLIEGQVSVRPGRATTFEHRTASTPTPERYDLSLEATPESDGRFLISVLWREDYAEGRRVVWNPSIVVRPGQEATADITWRGGGRSLRLSVK